MSIRTVVSLFLLVAYQVASQAQDNKLTFKTFEGVVVAGYADRGAYINSTGPAVKLNSARYTLLLGLLPSLKIKEDSSPIKNSVLTPTLGFGVTVTVLKRLAIQVPAFYLPKTTTTNGRWTVGAGIGYKI